MDVEQLLKDLAEAGGTLRVEENHYFPVDDQAIAKGLVASEPDGGGFGFMVTLSLTAKGRQMMGLPVIIPPPRVSLRTRLLGWLGGIIPNR